MKNVKKALSLIMAIAMLCGLLVVNASATDDSTSESTTPTTPIETFQVKKTLNVAAGTTIPDDTKFTIKMEPATDLSQADKDNKIQSGIAFSGNTITFTFDSNDKTDGKDYTGSMTKSDSFDLKGITFPTSGVYRYYISETAEKKATYITYDTTKYELDLVVKNFPSTGKLGVSQCILRKMNLVDDQYVVQKDKPTECVFTNTAKLAEATIKKTIDGTTAKANEQFDFYVWIPAGGEALDLKENATISAKIYRASTNTYETTNLVVHTDYDKNTKPTSEDMMGARSNKIQLGQDDKLIITGAPLGMIYFVMEDDYTDEGYTQSYIYTEKVDNDVGAVESSTLVNSSSTTEHFAVKDGSSVVVQGTVNTGGSEVEFINSYSMPNVDTGVILEVAPFVLILVLAAGLGLIYVADKRKEER